MSNSMQNEFGNRLFRILLTMSGLFMIIRSLTTIDLQFLYYPGWVVLTIATGTWLILEANFTFVRKCSLRFVGASMTILVTVWRIAAHVAAGPWIGEPLIDAERVISTTAAWVVIGTYTALLSAFGWANKKDIQ